MNFWLISYPDRRAQNERRKNSLSAAFFCRPHVKRCAAGQVHESMERSVRISFRRHAGHKGVIIELSNLRVPEIESVVTSENLVFQFEAGIEFDRWPGFKNGGVMPVQRDHFARR